MKTVRKMNSSGERAGFGRDSWGGSMGRRRARRIHSRAEPGTRSIRTVSPSRTAHSAFMTGGRGLVHPLAAQRWRGRPAGSAVRDDVFSGSPLLWAGFFVAVLRLLFVDLFLLHKVGGAACARVIASGAVWIGLALAFGATRVAHGRAVGAGFRPDTSSSSLSFTTSSSSSCCSASSRSSQTPARPVLDPRRARPARPLHRGGGGAARPLRLARLPVRLLPRLHGGEARARRVGRVRPGEEGDAAARAPLRPDERATARGALLRRREREARGDVALPLPPLGRALRRRLRGRLVRRSTG